jgi:hypothetical protein
MDLVDFLFYNSNMSEVPYPFPNPVEEIITTLTEIYHQQSEAEIAGENGTPDDTVGLVAHGWPPIQVNTV